MNNNGKRESDYDTKELGLQIHGFPARISGFHLKLQDLNMGEKQVSCSIQQRDSFP
jgi:hypothetical protein